MSEQVTIDAKIDRAIETAIDAIRSAALDGIAHVGSENHAERRRTAERQLNAICDQSRDYHRKHLAPVPHLDEGKHHKEVTPGGASVDGLEYSTL